MVVVQMPSRRVHRGRGKGLRGRELVTAVRQLQKGSKNQLPSKYRRRMHGLAALSDVALELIGKYAISLHAAKWLAYVPPELHVAVVNALARGLQARELEHAVRAVGRGRKTWPTVLDALEIPWPPGVSPDVSTTGRGR